MEETAIMVKFLCDSCGKDISEKVHDSVKQFCGRDYSWSDVTPRVTEDHGRQPPDVQHDIEQNGKRVHFEVQLLNELSKLIHASAWDMSTTTMQCGNCAMEYTERRRGKILTIFTRISEEECAF